MNARVSSADMSDFETAAPAAAAAKSSDVQPSSAIPGRRGLLARGLRWPRLPVISFSLTIAAAGIGLLFGILPAKAATLTPMIDTGVVLLFVPLALLVVAILAEAVRLSLRGPVRIREPHRVRTLSSWAP